jgi:hypothetical protein
LIFYNIPTLHFGIQCNLKNASQFIRIIHCLKNLSYKIISFLFNITKINEQIKRNDNDND